MLDLRRGVLSTCETLRSIAGAPRHHAGNKTRQSQGRSNTKDNKRRGPKLRLRRTSRWGSDRLTKCLDPTLHSPVILGVGIRGKIVFVVDQGFFFFTKPLVCASKVVDQDRLWMK